MKSHAQINFGNLIQGIIDRLINKYNTPASPIHSDSIETTHSGGFGSAVLAAAKADIGVHEDLGKNDGKRIREYFKHFGMGGGQDWCAAAVSTWMKEAGGGPIAGGVGARNIGEQFKQAGLWVPRDKITPSVLIPGNIMIWSRGGPESWKGHIGVLDSFDGKNGFTSIEANSGPKSDSVVRNSHNISDSNLLGVGVLSDYIPKEKSSIANATELVNLFHKLAINKF